MITVSIVSHNQSFMILPLLNDLRLIKNSCDIFVIVTINIDEDYSKLLDSNVIDKLIVNRHPFGFGANHNQAFQYAKGNFFLVLNPDVRLINFDLSELLSQFYRQTNAHVISPLAINTSGDYDHNARKFPSLLNLFKKYLSVNHTLPDYEFNTDIFSVDWVGGMFMLFRSSRFAELGGFDSDFFMYLEDVDICYRIKEVGGDVTLLTNLSFVHDAQRQSSKSLVFFKFHLVSYIRYFFKHPKQLFRF